MKRVFNNVTIQPALAKEGLRMRADVVRCVNLAFDVVQCDVKVASLDTNNAVGPDRGSVGDRNPVLNICHCFVSRIFKRMTCQMRSEVAGISMCRIPRGCSAFRMALMTTGGAATQPVSPAPFTPRGLVLHGSSLNVSTKLGISLARGIA